MSAPEFLRHPDVASRALGGAVVDAEHDVVGARALIEEAGRWRSGRRRLPGSEWVVVRLAAPAVVHGFDLDTTGCDDRAPAVTVEATTRLAYPTPRELADAEWFPLTERTPVAAGHNLIASSRLDRLVSHVRLRLHPDGELARFSVHGQVVADPRWLGGRQDLAAARAGGRVLACSSARGTAANVLGPGPGWSTPRRRTDGNEWLTVELAADTRIHELVVDTTGFHDDASQSLSLCNADDGHELLSRTALLPDCEQRFRVHSDRALRRVRFDLHPDGGIARLGVIGEVDPAARADITQLWLTLLPDSQRIRPDTSDFFS